MKPTALTEAIKQIEAEIDHFKELQNILDDLHMRAFYFNQRTALQDFKKVLISLLPKERQDIEEAYDDGFANGFGCGINNIDKVTPPCDDYFNQNFNQDITNQ